MIISNDWWWLMMTAGEWCWLMVDNAHRRYLMPASGNQWWSMRGNVNQPWSGPMSVYQCASISGNGRQCQSMLRIVKQFWLMPSKITWCWSMLVNASHNGPLSFICCWLYSMKIDYSNSFVKRQAVLSKVSSFPKHAFWFLKDNIPVLTANVSLVPQSFPAEQKRMFCWSMSVNILYKHDTSCNSIKRHNLFIMQFLLFLFSSCLLLFFLCLLCFLLTNKTNPWASNIFLQSFKQHRVE